MASKHKFDPIEKPGDSMYSLDRGVKPIEDEAKRIEAAVNEAVKRLRETTAG